MSEVCPPGTPDATSTRLGTRAKFFAPGFALHAFGGWNGLMGPWLVVFTVTHIIGLVLIICWEACPSSTAARGPCTMPATTSLIAISVFVGCYSTWRSYRRGCRCDELRAERRNGIDRVRHNVCLMSIKRCVGQTS